MHVASLEVELRLDGCFNLKDKRKILQSVLQKLRNELHVSAAEVGDQELWNSAVIGVACVSAHAQLADSILDRVVAKIDAEPEVEVVSVLRDIRRPGAD
jgi:uncharacterized protein YlxP (DUF503 family)